MDVTTETINDLPVLNAILGGLDIDKQIDAVYSMPKNWKGLSIGKITHTWLIYILSNCDHRLSHVEDWALGHLGILSTMIDSEIRREDFCDDKLGLLLEYFSGEEWNTFFCNYTKNVIEVYDLETGVFRVDATIGKSFRSVMEKGLFQMGSSKQFRPDLPQFKMMLATFDPLGIPVASLIVSGEKADDPLYIPVIAQTIKSTGVKHKLFVGDCKMSSIETRTFIENSENYYLSPLSAVQVPSDELTKYLKLIETGEIQVQCVYKDDYKDKIAKGFELIVKMSEKVNGESIEWDERRFVVRSFRYANSQIASLVARTKKAKVVLEGFNIGRQGKKIYTSEQELEVACKKIVDKYKISTIISYEIESLTTTKTIRGYKGNPGREETKTTFSVSVAVNKTVLEEQKAILGWRVYATNSPSSDFTLEAAVLTYRKEYIIEHNFDYLKNKLRLIPIYLHLEERVEGLINLLTLALSVLRLTENKIHETLAEKRASLKGLYAGNPQHATATPGAGLILRAFDNMHCTIVTETSEQGYEQNDGIINNQNQKPAQANTNANHIARCVDDKDDTDNKSTAKSTAKSTLKIFVSPLNALQITILELLGLSTTIYSDLEMCFICPVKIIKGRKLYSISRVNEKELNKKPLMEGLLKYFDDG